MGDPRLSILTPDRKKYSSLRYSILKVTHGTPSANSKESLHSESLSTFKRRAYSDTSLDSLSKSKSLALSENQGLFELHLEDFNLTDIGIQTMRSAIPGTVHFRLIWEFLDETRTTPKKELIGFFYRIEMSLMYKVDISEDFFCMLAEMPISFLLAASHGDGPELYVAKGNLSLRQLLHDPRSIVHCSVEFYNTDTDLVSSNMSIERCYGHLSIWFSLSGKLQDFGSFIMKELSKPQHAASAESNISNELINTTSKDADRHYSKMMSFATTSSTSSIKPTESEYVSFKEALRLVLNRNKALRTTQSEISNELKDGAKWLHEECDWRRTLQEYAILRGEDPFGVQWRQWRDEKTGTVRLRSYPSEVQLYIPEVVIFIHYIKFYSNAPVLKNNGIAKVYIEYSFLGREGPEMETPNSVQKSTGRMYFDFERRFSIDMEKNHKTCITLANSIKSKTPIIFSVVGEPPEDTLRCQTCEEIAVCTVDLFELIQSEENEDYNTHSLKDPKNLTGDDIGEMALRVRGVLAMRRTALCILAPATYNIIV